MIDRKISIHLQDFPDLSFIDENKDLVANMDFVRAICSAALSIRDNKNLRVRLPLNRLTIIGKNATKALDFKDIIADEVNVKNIEIQEEIQGLAEIKLQVNFKKIGAKYGSKVKEIMACINQGKWQKIDENTIEVAGISLIGDEFDLKLTPTKKDDENTVILALPSNDCLVCLDIKITPELFEEGISRDLIRAIQQARKDADFDVSDHVKVAISCENEAIINAAKKFAEFIKEQVLADEIAFEKSQDKADFSCESKIEDGNLTIGLKRC